VNDAAAYERPRFRAGNAGVAARGRRAAAQRGGLARVTVPESGYFGPMAKDHGPSVKNDKQYEGLRKKGMSKERAAKIANTPGASKKGGKRSGKRSS